MKTLNFTCENRDFLISIGRNALENWKLIDSSNKDDLWFHVEGHPSGHVVAKEITTDAKKDSNKTKSFNFPYVLILECARHCKNQSKFKNERCKIIYTTINNITKGKEIGSVFTKNEKYVTV
jgi:predicted ribosome quality control (RQC) complex YloA/Tae2 family protein